MPFENTSGLNVYTQYGKRATGGTAGVNNEYETLEFDFTGTSLNEGFLPPVVVPIGTHFRRAILRVNEAFAIAGTTPTVIFGGTVPGTNGFVLSEAELENIGTKVPASVGVGTWAFASATGTTAAERCTVALTGAGVAVTSGVGRASLILEFAYETK